MHELLLQTPVFCTELTAVIAPECIRTAPIVNLEGNLAVLGLRPEPGVEHHAVSIFSTDAQKGSNRLYSLCELIQNSQIGTGIRESLFVFPIIEAVHVLALGLSVGTLVWFDLRLLGWIMPDQPVSKFHRQIMPWAVLGFALMFLSGGYYSGQTPSRHTPACTFVSNSCSFSLLAATRGVRIRNEAKYSEVDSSPVLPRKVKVAGLLSILLWIAVITFGRATAYHLS